MIPNIEIKTDLVAGVVVGLLLFFFLFWKESGWYRVDCALGVQPACALIEAEYAKEAKP